AYRMGAIVEDVAGMIRVFGREQAVVVGHDWGGAAAYAFAMMHPEMAQGLVVLNCPHPVAFSRALQENYEQLKKSWYMFFFQLPEAPEAILSAHRFRFLKQFAYANSRRGTFSPATLRKYEEAMAKPGALTGAINWYRAMFRAGLPPLRELPKISAPALVIWGTRDHFLGQELTRGMRRHFSGPFRIVHLSGVSHWVQQEAPGRVNQLLVSFLNRFIKKRS
ncbi:MAG: alpha/beta fold hydrolase, partial [Candidatus Methylomirabilia bacterium]